LGKGLKEGMSANRHTTVWAEGAKEPSAFKVSVAGEGSRGGKKKVRSNVQLLCLKVGKRISRIINRGDFQKEEKNDE